MNRFVITIATIVLLISLSAFASDKAHDWQIGRLLDSEQAQQFVGENAVFVENYTIETETHVYVASQPLKFKWTHTFGVTVGGPIKFSIEKDSLYILDDAGKEHKTRLVKTSLKQ